MLRMRFGVTANGPTVEFYRAPPAGSQPRFVTQSRPRALAGRDRRLQAADHRRHDPAPGAPFSYEGEHRHLRIQDP